MNYFFLFFLLGFFIASMQDLKRREVDNWLNLFIFFSGFIFLIFNLFKFGEITLLTNFSILVFFMFFLVYLFYFSRIFAGGDCKLLFAITPLLVSFDLANSFHNIFIFCVIMLFIGAVYGLMWILGVFIYDFKNNKEDFIKKLRELKWFGLVFIGLFILGFFESTFFILLSMFLFLFFTYIISKSIEKNSFTKLKKPSELREGDWIEKDIRVGGKIIKSSFDGLSNKEIGLLRKFNKSVRVKDGIPYAPVFLFSWIVFYFRGFFVEWFFKLIG